MPAETDNTPMHRADLQQNGSYLPSFQSTWNEDAHRRTEHTFPDKHTVSNLISWASKMLHDHGIDSPRLDAEVILSYLLDCKRISFYVHPDKSVENPIAVGYQKAIQRRSHRVPLHYITHHAEFMSLDFYVDERVLIPRPETELVVEAVIKKSQILSKEEEIVMVDIGVGSGNIAIALAKKIDKARVFAVDISPDALSVAAMNAQRHEVLNTITFLCGDIFTPLEGYGIEGKADFIISNPPYVSSTEFSTLQNEVRDHEPYIALVSGEDGFHMFKRIIAHANTWLRPGGFIMFEVGEKQAQQVAQFIENTGRFKKPELVKDYQNIDRIVVAQMEESCG